MAGTTSPDSAKVTGFRRAAVILLGIIGGIQVFDPVVSSIALVQASADLKFPATTQALAAGISTLALAATVIPGGLVADRLGRRRVLMGALVVTAIGELTTAFGPTITTYLLGRVIAGIALGIVFGASYGLLRDVAAEDSLGPAMGLFNVMNLAITAVVVVAAGILTLTSWRFAYMLAPIVCAICFLLVPRILPKVPMVPGGRIDFAGMILIGLGVVGVLYGVSNAAKTVTDPSCWVPILLGLLCLAAFAVVERRVAYPIFPIRLLAHPAFLGAVVMGTFWNFANGSLGQMLPNVWQYIEAWGTGRVSVFQLVIALFSAIGALWAGRRLGGRNSRPYCVSNRLRHDGCWLLGPNDSRCTSWDCGVPTRHDPGRVWLDGERNLAGQFVDPTGAQGVLWPGYLQQGHCRAIRILPRPIRQYRIDQPPHDQPSVRRNQRRSLGEQLLDRDHGLPSGRHHHRLGPWTDCPGLAGRDVRHVVPDHFGGIRRHHRYRRDHHVPATTKPRR